MTLPPWWPPIPGELLRSRDERGLVLDDGSVAWTSGARDGDLADLEVDAVAGCIHLEYKSTRIIRRSILVTPADA